LAFTNDWQTASLLPDMMHLYQSANILQVRKKTGIPVFKLITDDEKASKIFTITSLKFQVDDSY
jgi:hypothetical protein